MLNVQCSMFNVRCSIKMNIEHSASTSPSPCTTPSCLVMRCFRCFCCFCLHVLFLLSLDLTTAEQSHPKYAVDYVWPYATSIAPANGLPVSSEGLKTDLGKIAEKVNNQEKILSNQEKNLSDLNVRFNTAGLSVGLVVNVFSVFANAAKTIDFFGGNKLVEVLLGSYFHSFKFI